MAFTRVVGPGIHTQSNIDSHNIKSTGIITATKFDGPFENFNATGILTAASANFTGNVTIGGTLTYEDVKNIDSVGLVTARDGIFLPDNKIAHFGNAAGSGDLKIYHSASSGLSYIRQDGTGPLDIRSVNDINIRDANDGDLFIKCEESEGVKLYYEGDQKLEITNTGATVTGTLKGASEVGIQSGGVQIGAGITQLNFVGTGNTFAVNGTTVDISIQGGGGTGAGGTWSSYTAGIATTKSVGINTSNLDDNDLVGVGNSLQGLYISNGMMITDNSLNGNHYIGTAFNGLMAGPVNIEGTLTIDGNYVVV